MQNGFKGAMITPILLIVVFALVLASSYLPEDLLGLDENPYLAVVVIHLLTYSVPSLFYCRIRGKDLTASLRVRPFKPNQMLYLVYSTGFLIGGVILISMLMYTLVPDSFETGAVTEYAAFAMNQRFFDSVYLVIAFAILPAVTEEFLFRSIVVGEYERYGVFTAVMMSAILFAMSHFSVARIPVYLFSGLVLCGVMYTTRSVIASMVVHGLNNTVVLLSEKYILRIVDKQNTSLTLLTILLGALTILCAMLMCYEAQTIYRGYAEENVPSPYAHKQKHSVFSRIAEAFFSPTFLLLVVAFVIASMARF